MTSLRVVGILVFWSLLAGCGGSRENYALSCDGGCAYGASGEVGEEAAVVAVDGGPRQVVDALEDAGVVLGVEEDSRPDEGSSWWSEAGSGLAEAASSGDGGVDAGADVAAGGDLGGPDSYCGSQAVPAGQSLDDSVVVAGRSVGALHGLAWVNAGKDDVVTSPVCEAKGPDGGLGGGRDCAGHYVWEGSTSLCVSGIVPRVTPEVLSTGVDWGLAVGVDADGCGRTLGRSYAEVAATVVGVPRAALDAGLYHLGLEVRDPATGEVVLYYGNDGGTGKYLPLTTFTTHWWDDAGVSLREDQVQDVQSFVVYVHSSTTVATTVSSMCLLEVSFR